MYKYTKKMYFETLILRNNWVLNMVLSMGSDNIFLFKYGFEYE